MEGFRVNGRFRVAVVLVGLLGAALPPVHAQDFPSKPITLMHGFGAGGNADTMARILGDAMSKGLGQRVLVEPKPGASGTIASELLTRAAPDGHTLLMLTAAHATTANLFKNLKYDPNKDFAAVTSIGFFPYVIAVRKDHPFNSVADLIAAAKERPGAITFTSVGSGSVPHLTGELLAAQAGIKLAHVPYRGGTAPMTDVLGGRVDVLIDTQTVSMPQITSGTARGIGVTSRAPWPGTPGVPTVASTLPGFEVESWIGLVTVRDTPPQILARLNREAVQALTSEEVAAKLRGLGADVRPSAPEAMQALIGREIERWGQVIRQAGIQGTN
jgi:tripartite-type tricarboxylate transporter receptor subunit TctC